MLPYINQSLYDKVETIVRQSGDQYLNIDNFIEKMVMEVELNGGNIDMVANINDIPKNIVEELYISYLNNISYDLEI